MDRYELRRLDYSLDADHVALQSTYREFLDKNCTMTTVRDAESLGFDQSLWARLCTMGATSMSLPESVGGDGATLVDLVLVAEELGRSLAPVPWIDHVCSARLLAGLGTLAENDLLDDDVLHGWKLVAMDCRLDPSTGPVLIPSGAVANQVVTRAEADLVLLGFDTPPDKVDNIGHLPMAWVDADRADTKTVLATGSAAIDVYQRALDEWRLLTASALVGLVDESLRIAVEFAKTRYTLGVSIGTLQAISHPLANIAITVESGRNLARRAAWFLDNEPDAHPELALSAFLFMSEEAAKATTMAVHVQGGLGVSVEAPASAYLVRARGWALAGGDPGAAAVKIGQLLAERGAGNGRI